MGTHRTSFMSTNALFYGLQKPSFVLRLLRSVTYNRSSELTFRFVETRASVETGL